ncbi:hypothetical protein D6833_07065, partial [Candidatus Parcubacteria bacterium]
MTLMKVNKRVCVVSLWAFFAATVADTSWAGLGGVDTGYGYGTGAVMIVPMVKRDDKLCDVVEDMIYESVAAHSKSGWQAVEKDLAKKAIEQMKIYEGFEDDNTLINLGRQISAKWVLGYKLYGVGLRERLHVRLVNAEKGVVVMAGGIVLERRDDRRIEEATKKLVGAILEGRPLEEAGQRSAIPSPVVSGRVVKEGRAAESKQGPNYTSSGSETVQRPKPAVVQREDRS